MYMFKYLSKNLQEKKILYIQIISREAEFPIGARSIGASSGSSGQKETREYDIIGRLIFGIF